MTPEPQQPAPKPVGLIQAIIYFLMACGHFLNTVTPILQVGFSQFMEIRNAVGQPPASPTHPKPGPVRDTFVSGSPASAGQSPLGRS